MPKPKAFNATIQFIRATVKKDSFDPDKGTFDLTFATETPALSSGLG